MTAGSVPVPTIIPIRPPIPGKSKLSIDSNTKIELSTEGKQEVSIYYTINGTKPNPFPKVGVEKCTMQYMGPFTLPAGKQTVKALALSKDGMRESNVVTKIFEVEFVPVPHTTPEDDDLGFQEEIDREKAKLSVKRSTQKFLMSERSAWTDMTTMKAATQKLSDMSVTGSTRRKARDEPRFLNTRRSRETGRYDSPTSHRVHSERRLPETTAAMRLEQELDNMKNSYYTGDIDLYGKYRNEYEDHSPSRATISHAPKMGMCQYCRSVVPFNVPTCVVCEAPIPGQHKPNPQTQWLPVSYPIQTPATPPSKPPSRSVHTQTVGLFYPSDKELSKKVEQEEEKKSFEKQMKDRRPLLTAVSPGKGYWRKQVDHICAHLKAHAQNEAEFRALIGEPKMGKLLTSTVQEDGYELSVTLTFAIRSNKDPLAGRKIAMSGDYLSQHTEQDSWRNSDSDEEIIAGKKRTKKSKPKKKVTPKMAAIDQKLLRELGHSGEGDPAEVQQLIDEGANVECTNKDGLPCLYVAVKNKRVESIPVLVGSGADVNMKGPSSIKGNTPLHEAVGLGPSGLKVIDTLLNSGADQSKKNDRGETPYDLAVKGGYDSIAKKFASALGSSQLQKMIKPRSTVAMD
ncbi:hypothetical protein FSP39_002533 [Pinctada imbricata]|uniref:Double zinc ribbon and ankyrin repeat-containing protein 1 n=1 Tax=Pinctada imbricata TaxID=66713 RepID=A0AA88Y241_PINIB|nr:hypothetical protein FSP39_002533 [Pinctada imbricata]